MGDEILKKIAHELAESLCKNISAHWLTSSFKLWLKDGDYFATQIDSHVPDAKLLYTGQRWESGDESKVGEEWVMRYPKMSSAVVKPPRKAIFAQPSNMGM